ncbi:MAG: hypothetical protein OEY63_02330, partial [Gemmatimonadota bacterium]|nr:hypothetical protein [Gemmatimonadota bacterium]
MRATGKCRNSFSSFLALCAILLTGACDLGQGKVAFVGGTLWNGTGAPPIYDAVVIVSDGKIDRAGPPDEVKVPPKAEVRRMDGKFIIPGLIDGHGH